MSANDDARRQAELVANLASLDKLLRNTNGDEFDALRNELKTLQRGSMSANEFDALHQNLKKLQEVADTRATDVPADLVFGHPQYSAKCAAIWHARSEVRPDNLGRLRAKDALKKWFTAHKLEYNLSNSAIKECTAVANWDTKGGATETPGTPPTQPRKPRR